VVSDDLVLAYHGISATWPSPLAVTPARFEAQLWALRRRGFASCTFAELTSSPGRGRRVAVTFDDSLASVIRHGLPIMRRHGLVGTIFVVTDFVGKPHPAIWPGLEQWANGPHRDELLQATWEELRALAADGWEIGSHTRSHTALVGLGDRELERELVLSRERCGSEIGRECTTIAYPYGVADARVGAAARAAGYQAGAVLTSTLDGSDRHLWPRVGVYRHDGRGRLALKLSPAARHVRSTALWRPIGARRAATVPGSPRASGTPLGGD
jgi:peptidoglycan/xylan/chitin deacetylase (PgdA/CDA1 family)